MDLYRKCGCGKAPPVNSKDPIRWRTTHLKQWCEWANPTLREMREKREKARNAINATNSRNNKRGIDQSSISSELPSLLDNEGKLFLHNNTHCEDRRSSPQLIAIT